MQKLIDCSNETLWAELTEGLNESGATDSDQTDGNKKDNPNDPNEASPTPASGGSLWVIIIIVIILVIIVLVVLFIIFCLKKSQVKEKQNEGAGKISWYNLEFHIINGNTCRKQIFVDSVQ